MKLAHRIDRDEALHLLQDEEFLALGASVTQEQLDERSKSLDADDPINIQFTSGTTGFPKPVLLTHHNVLNNALLVGRQLGFTQWDRLCVPVPFYHCFGMVLSNLCCLCRGATIVVPEEHFDALAVVKAIDAEGTIIGMGDKSQMFP